jgi:hypothetical protein
LEDFDVISDVVIRPEAKVGGLGLSNSMRPPYQFADYPPVAYIQCVFQTKEVIFPSEYRLRVTQTYVLTNYSSSPAHEPTGGLSAARIFPLFTFETIDENGKMVHGPDAFRNIRADYRLRLKLDVFLSQSDLSREAQEQKDMPPSAFIAAIKSGPQQAGLFRDVNNPPLDNYAVPPTPGTMVFSSAEKPLKHEISAPGLSWGRDFYGLATEPKGTTRYTWHNIHWWGGYKQYHQLSAPGAFHAAHLHWKWGDYVQEWAVYPWHIGEKQFRGGTIGGALLDPNIRRQTINIYVLKKEDRFILDSDALASAAARRKEPFGIADGSDIECWYSATAERITEFFNRGTFFIHGLFFAHDPEPEYTLLTGPFGPLYKNPDNPSTQWLRTPEGPFRGPKMGQ